MDKKCEGIEIELGPGDDVPEFFGGRGVRLFNDASKIINGERQTSYGDPEDSFDYIAVRWSQYLTARYADKDEYITLYPEDVAFMLADFKMARECFQHKRDNIVDAVGYAGILDDMNLANGDTGVGLDPAQEGADAMAVFTSSVLSDGKSYELSDTAKEVLAEERVPEPFIGVDLAQEGVDKQAEWRAEVDRQSEWTPGR